LWLVTLSERLEAARRQRLDEERARRGEALLPPPEVHEPDDVVVDATEWDAAPAWDPTEVTIEVAPKPGLRLVAPLRHDDPAPGEPAATRRWDDADDDRWMIRLSDDTFAAHCPNCAREAQIDMVDLVGHTTHYSCPACGTLWQVPGVAPIETT
jgi:hypothetical protein